MIAALTAAGVEYRAYWITNMIWVRGDARLARAMAQRDDVEGVRANPAVRLRAAARGCRA